MRKLSLADKLAKKTFESAEFQKSWAVHMAAFGPILEPAFPDNYQAKVHLTAVLNLISSRQITKAMSKLNQLQKFCETDADKTVFLFVLGICFELSGDREHMAEFYSAANEYGHSLPMPYLKAGKYFLENHDYAAAHDSYRGAIRCYQATGLSDQDKLVLGAAYTNLATCLTMMHHYEEAEQAVFTSRSLYPDAPGRAAVEAALLALKKDTAGLSICLEALQSHAPEVYEAVKESTDKILAGTDPLFFPVPFDAENITGFWNWFASYSSTFLELLEQQKYEQAMQTLGEHLLEAFPFLEEVPYVALGKNEQGYVLELKDGYAVGIAAAYDALTAAIPESVAEKWQFIVTH